MRCLFLSEHQQDEPDTRLYEERITLWHERSAEAAMTRAELEARKYAALTETQVLDFRQSYALLPVPGHGAEVFSLIRESGLPPEAYISAFFDTGAEKHQRTT